jgi:hypothetical protein
MCTATSDLRGIQNTFGPVLAVGRSKLSLGEAACVESTFNKLITSPPHYKHTHWNKLIITDLYSASVNKL